MKLRGKVVAGAGIGRKLGYPTANLECVNVEYPRSGVYAARVVFNDSAYHAVAVIGARLEREKSLIEVLVLDFHGDLYDKKLEVEVLDKLSEIKEFKNEKALVAKIENDIRKARVCLQGLFKRPGA